MKQRTCEVLRNKSEDGPNIKEEIGWAELGCYVDNCHYKYYS